MADKWYENYWAEAGLTAFEEAGLAHCVHEATQEQVDDIGASLRSYQENFSLAFPMGDDGSWAYTDLHDTAQCARTKMRLESEVERLHREVEAYRNEALTRLKAKDVWVSDSGNIVYRR